MKKKTSMSINRFLDEPAKAEKQHTGNTAIQQNRKEEAQELIKATFYMPESLMDRFDTLWMKKRKGNRKVKKSPLAVEIFSKGIALLEEE